MNSVWALTGPRSKEGGLGQARRVGEVETEISRMQQMLADLDA